MYICCNNDMLISDFPARRVIENKRKWHFYITMSIIYHSCISILIRLFCTTQSPDGREWWSGGGGRVMAQIWRPDIDQHLFDLNGFTIYNYDGNLLPKFSIWPGNLFQNYSFISVSTVCSTMKHASFINVVKFLETLLMYTRIKYCTCNTTRCYMNNVITCFPRFYLWWWILLFCRY